MREMHAWIDESGSDSRRDPNTYILAAALCAQGAMDEVRAQMLPLLTRGHRKVRWSDETKPARRRAITEVVRSCGIAHLIVVRQGQGAETRDRPRNAALAQLLRELDRRQVVQAVLESRGRVDDRRDRTLHDRLRRNREIAGTLKMSHEVGPADAGLWVADALCGAVSSSRTGAPEYLELLGGQVTVVTIDWHGNRL